MNSGLVKRLVGAAVLIALAVIFVPMLLPRASPDGPHAVSVKIPPEPDAALQTRLLKVGPGRASAGSSTAAVIRDSDHVATLDLDGERPAPGTGGTLAAGPAAAPVPLASVAAPAASTPPTAPGAIAASAASTAPPPLPRPVAGGAGVAAHVSYTVNLGIYADHASAATLVANARQHGLQAQATPETFRGKSVLRVRAGPYASRAAAEAARLKLQDFEPIASMTIDAQAADQTGDAPASALTAGQPGAWAVQLGAFSTRGQANLVRDRLRKQGFDGYVDDVKTAQGTLWRVRAGPYATRVAAIAARTRIDAAFGLKSAIVTQQ